MPAATKITGLDASYYYAKDLDRATKFYTELLEMSPTMVFPPIVSEWTFPSGENFWLYCPASDASSHFTPAHGVMFAVDDLQAAVAKHKARGVKLSDDITETPGCFMAHGVDSEGNDFILHKRK